MSKLATALLVKDEAPVGPIMPLATPEAMTEAMKAYEALKRAALSDNDEQEITVKGKKRKFIKRSGWRRLSIAFGVSTTILDRKVTAGQDGRTISAEFTVRATAPNGRFADGWGACSAWEERFQDEGGRKKMEHDIPATAETRAENRACSNLFGYGEVSAEEMEDSPEVARPTCPKCGKPVRESTFAEGEWYCWTKRGGCGWQGRDPITQATGEIASGQASPASVEAMRAVAAASSPPSQGAATTPQAVAPPAAEVNSAAVKQTNGATTTAAPAHGPRAKRQNVVPAPQGAEKSANSVMSELVAAGAPNPAVAPEGIRQVAPAQPASPPVDLDGKEIYLDTLRQEARQVAARVAHLRVRLQNHKAKQEIALGTKAALALPPLTPTIESDAALQRFITARWPKKMLHQLDEAELDGTDKAPGVLRILNGIVEQIHDAGV